jgi:hypothetical protein
MLWAIGIILLANWILGLLSGAALGAWVHLLLVTGLIALVFGVLDALRGGARRGPARADD